MAGAAEARGRVNKMMSFESLFQRSPELTASAPGRATRGRAIGRRPGARAALVDAGARLVVVGRGARDR